jgi:hypothetical protein
MHMMHCFTERVCVHQTVLPRDDADSDASKVYKISEIVENSLHASGWRGILCCGTSLKTEHRGERQPRGWSRGWALSLL